ncbi:peptidylprolyl isomerase [Tenacibaculum holothuriorum]|uniref:Peptidyl-prolyl cis-trans isomerase n=1 Tax=Tenacibaculum holothuriorum TaxID=1635173 RepID=A0A1Y2PHV6_9FLAO|nr:FKBP-type peptidyl-prolyl cis-trans isomerase [Tenacibaculum holothuriorum]OSY89258.1 peptidylprolyl isomerase [Tenacibaculum holothuriorum]
MIKFKHLFLTIIGSVVLYSCGSDNNTTPFDHEAQAKIDNDSIVKFLMNHYYDTDKDSVKPLVAGKVALLKDADTPNDPSKLKIQTYKEGDVEYKLYVYVAREGAYAPSEDKGFPTVMDSVYIKYSGQRIVNKDSLTSPFDGATRWFTLNGVVRGWTHGISGNFKGGNNITNNGPITFENGGKGVLFIPSGLAYRNLGNGNIPGNANLMFYVNLFDIVKDTDHDNDGVASIFEDPDKDGDPRNDDTDGDRVANFGDVDDDGDGKLTKDEDANGDGDPRNDFSDPNKPDVPDYLNRDIR